MSRDGATSEVPLPDRVYVAYPAQGRRFLLSAAVTHGRALQLINTRRGAWIVEADDRAQAFQRAAEDIGRTFRDQPDPGADPPAEPGPEDLPPSRRP